MIKYSVAMGIRALCIVACLFVRDWWLLIPAIGAVVLPYFAVVIANVGSRPGSTVERPGSIVLIPQPPAPDAIPQHPTEPRDAADGGDRTDGAA
jgi:hypothetical protein